MWIIITKSYFAQFSVYSMGRQPYQYVFRSFNRRKTGHFTIILYWQHYSIRYGTAMESDKWHMYKLYGGDLCSLLELVRTCSIRGRRTGDCSTHREAVITKRSTTSLSYSSRAGSTSSVTAFLYSNGFACQENKFT